MSETWTISVGGRVYGPYDLSQMQGFHAEGRLADHSLVARAGEDQFHPAQDDAELSNLFAVPAATHSPASFGRGEAEPTSGLLNHYVIIADMKSRSVTGLDEEIFGLGQAHRFMPSAWVLASEAAINTIRHALVQRLGKMDAIFIVDAGHDKAAWFNFGPEVDARVRKIWQRPTDASVKRAV